MSQGTSTEGHEDEAARRLAGALGPSMIDALLADAKTTGAWLSSPRHGPPMTTPQPTTSKAVAVRRLDQLGGLLHEYQHVARGVRRFWHPQVIEHMRRARWQPVPPGPGSPAGYPRLLGHPDPCPAAHGLRLHAELPQTHGCPWFRSSAGAC